MYQMLNEVDDDVLHCTSRRLHDADGALAVAVAKKTCLQLSNPEPQARL